MMDARLAGMRIDGLIRAMRSWQRPARRSGDDVPLRQRYQRMLATLQRNMLRLFLAIQVPGSLILSLQTHAPVFRGEQPMSASFLIQNGHLPLVVAAVWLCLRSQAPVQAWLWTLAINLSTILALSWLLGEPGGVLMIVFTLAGAAIVLPWVWNLGALLAVDAVISAFMATSPPWSSGPASNVWSMLIALHSLAFALWCVGLVIRRSLWDAAYTSLALEQQMIAQARMEQQMEDIQGYLDQLSTLEHDLRQPLRAIQGNLTVLGLGIAPHEQPAILATTRAAALRADRLINNVLELTRVEAAQTAIIRRAITLGQLHTDLAPICDGLARYYTEPPIPIRITTQQDVQVIIDVDQVERALLNLIDNALAVSPPGGRITMDLGHDDQYVTITVCDQGPGIPATLIDALREHKPIQSTRTRRPGLGLRQVAAMLEAHQGTLAVETTAAGTTIALCLPLR